MRPYIWMEWEWTLYLDGMGMEQVDGTGRDEVSTTPTEMVSEATDATLTNRIETAIIRNCKEQSEDQVVSIQGPYAVIIKSPLDSTKESTFKNAFNNQGSNQHCKPICGKRNQQFHTPSRSGVLFNDLKIGFDELLTSLDETVRGHLRGNGVYSMKYQTSITSDEQFQHPLHLDEGCIWEHGGCVYHAYSFLSLLRPVNGPRLIQILTKNEDGTLRIETIMVQTDEILALSPNVWHAGTVPAEPIVRVSPAGLLFAYYNGKGMPVVTVEDADDSPFALTVNTNTEKIKSNRFPAYCTIRKGDGTHQEYHYSGNRNKYNISPSAKWIGSESMATHIQRFDNMAAFTNHVQENGLVGFNDQKAGWTWTLYRRHDEIDTQSILRLIVPIMKGCLDDNSMFEKQRMRSAYDQLSRHEKEVVMKEAVQSLRKDRSSSRNGWWSAAEESEVMLQVVTKFNGFRRMMDLSPWQWVHSVSCIRKNQHHGEEEG